VERSDIHQLARRVRRRSSKSLRGFDIIDGCTSLSGKTGAELRDENAEVRVNDPRGHCEERLRRSNPTFPWLDGLLRWRSQ
jgi:hypothetical protein